MFLRFDWGPKEIGSREISGECQACEDGKLYLVCFQTILSFFFLPLVPLKKTTIITCGNCGESVDVSITKLDSASKKAFHFKTPLKVLWGWLVIFAIVIFFYYLDYNDKKAIEEFRSNPQPGTYFIYNNKEAPYGFAKIERFEKKVIYAKISTGFYMTQDLAIKAAKNSKKNPRLFGAIVEPFNEESFDTSDPSATMLDNGKIDQIGGYFVKQLHNGYSIC